MSLGDDIAWGLAGLQQQAESMMDDACVIERHDSASKVWDEATMRYDHPTLTIYEGRCRVRILAVQPKSPAAGEAEYAKVGYRISVPMSATGITHGDVVRITSAARDDALIGREFIVGAAPASTHQTARRLTVSEVL